MPDTREECRAQWARILTEVLHLDPNEETEYDWLTIRLELEDINDFILSDPVETRRGPDFEYSYEIRITTPGEGDADPESRVETRLLHQGPLDKIAWLRHFLKKLQYIDNDGDSLSYEFIEEHVTRDNYMTFATRCLNGRPGDDIPGAPSDSGVGSTHTVTAQGKLAAFQKQIKIDPKLYPVFNNPVQWYDFSTRFESVARSQRLYPVLDPTFVPSTDDSELFRMMQVQMIPIFDTCMATAKSKALFRQHRNDPSTAYRLIKQHYEESRIGRDRIDGWYYELHSMDITDWNLSHSEFLIRFDDVRAKYQDNAIDDEALTMFQFKRMLRRAVQKHKEFAAVDMFDTVSSTKAAKRELDYFEYLSSLSSLAEALDSATDESTTLKARRTVKAANLFELPLSTFQLSTNPTIPHDRLFGEKPNTTFAYKTLVQDVANELVVQANQVDKNNALYVEPDLWRQLPPGARKVLMIAGRDQRAEGTLQVHFGAVEASGEEEPSLLPTTDQPSAIAEDEDTIEDAGPTDPNAPSDANIRRLLSNGSSDKTKTKAALLGKGSSIISSVQLEAAGVTVEDSSLLFGGKQRIVTQDKHVLPLNMESGLMYLEISKPTWDDLKKYPCVHLTSNTEWDPSALNVPAAQVPHGPGIEEPYDFVPDPFDLMGNFLESNVVFLNVHPQKVFEEVQHESHMYDVKLVDTVDPAVLLTSPQGTPGPLLSDTIPTTDTKVQKAPDNWIHDMDKGRHVKRTPPDFGQLRRRIAVEGLDFETPLFCLTGQRPDISMIFLFYFWQPV
ncbi:MAG: hypothetical protein AAGM67_00705, partial [Bacteroidota bacterium]